MRSTWYAGDGCACSIFDFPPTCARLGPKWWVQVEADVECDTFMPPIDEKKFRLWAATAPRCVFQLVCASSLCSLCDNRPYRVGVARRASVG